MLTNDLPGQTLRTALNTHAPHEGAGDALNKTKNCLKAIWDFATLGGAASSINLLDEFGNAAVLPKGAYVTNVVAIVKTTATSGGSATLSLDALATADLMAATAVASLVSTAGSELIAGKPVGTKASWVGPITAVAGTNVTATIAVAAMTAGKIIFSIEYVIT